MKVFVEEQRFKRWVLVSLIIAPSTVGLIPLILGKKEIPTFESDGFWGLVVGIVSISLVFILLLSIKLSTKINEQGIYYQYFPHNLSEKFISWDEINRCYLTKQSKYGLPGGYGYNKWHFFGKKGLIMDLGGKYGIQLTLKNKKKY